MKQNVIEMNGGITINVAVSIKNRCEKDYVWNPATCNWENGKYLASIMDASVITCGENVKPYNEEITIPIKFSWKKIYF